jgi:hypothetical protein
MISQFIEFLFSRTLRLEGGGPILNIEVGRFRVSKSTLRQVAPERSGFGGPASAWSLFKLTCIM